MSELWIIRSSIRILGIYRTCIDTVFLAPAEAVVTHWLLAAEVLTAFLAVREILGKIFHGR